MATLLQHICNIRSVLMIIVNIVILIELCSTAPTLIPQNLPKTSKIVDENVTKESSLKLLNIMDELVITTSTTEFPRANRNVTKPTSVQKTKKLTKTINTKKLKEKSMKYSINNAAKQQIRNNSVKNKAQIDGSTTSTLPSILITQDETIPTDSTMQFEMFTENINHSTFKYLKTTDDREELTPTKSPVIITTAINSHIRHLSKVDESDMTQKNNKTTSITPQIPSTPGKQLNLNSSPFRTTKSELIMSTPVIASIKDNEKMLESESSTPLTMNINILQGFQQNTTDKTLSVSNSILSKDIENEAIVSTPTVYDDILNIAEKTPKTIENAQPPLISYSDLTASPFQTKLSEKLMLTTEIHKDEVINATVTSLLDIEGNHTKIAGTVNVNNTAQIINLDSETIILPNKKTETNIESATTPIYDINAQNTIKNSTLTNTTTKINNGSIITLMGHDGVKITKKKQLVEKHAKDEFTKQSLTKMNIHNDSHSSDENIEDNKMERDYNKLEIANNSLDPIIMTDEIITTTITDENNEDVKNMVSTTAAYIEGETTTQENIEEFTTEPEDNIATTILLDIDLMPKQSQIETMTELPTLSTTENEFIKHKNFEKSLISKMEWMPIENVDHSLVNPKEYETKTDKEEIFDESTNLPLQLTSEINGHEIKANLLANTEFVPTTKLKTESDPKSLEIELIDSAALSDKNIKTVPEFFEIATSKQHQNNNEKDSDSAPIEIQINVSEGFGNETENLEFSFRQQPQRPKQKHIAHLPPPGFQEIGEITIQRTPDLNTLQSIPLLDYKHKTENDEILQVEITAIDNTTKVDEKQIEALNDTPKFTVHNEQNLEIRENDDFFVPDLKMDPIEDTGVGKNLENSERDSVDQDSDTIFYISNTEVKVVESLPSSNISNHDLGSIKNGKNISQHLNRSKLESQFFPTIYEEDVLIDTSLNQKNQSKLNSFEYNKESKYPQEDIILSPIKKFLEPMKNNYKNTEEIILNSAETPYKSPAAVAAAAAPDVSYVGETFIEIEESTSNPNEKNNRKLSETHTMKTTTSTKKDTDFPVIIMDADMNSSGALLSDVIIQPAVVPEMSIGVPVIGELPPQIELKEIDFLPSNGGKENHDRLTDGGSIQYGADLIADEAELNDNPNRYIFESGYPFTDEKINRVGRVSNNEELDILDRDENDPDNDDIMATSQQIIMHAVDNFQHEQLIADIPSDNWEGYKEIPIKRNNVKPNNIVVENSTNYINNSTNFLNSTGVNATELLGNATAFSVLEDNDVTDFNLADVQTLIIACLATLVPLILSLLTAFGLRYLWIKYRRDHDEGSGLVGDSSTDPLAAKSVAISQDELQTTDSGYTLNRSNDTLESNTDITGRTSGIIIDGVVNGVSHDGISQCTNGLGDVITISTNQPNGNAVTNKNLSNHCGANGSVTTMTLKNNHLIVETEERNDISRDARETKMHYTSSEKDGVFVVEVARGADSTGAPGSPHKDLNNHQKSYNIDIDYVEQKQPQDECNHEEVQIHQPPAEPDTLIEVDESTESPIHSEKYKQCHNLGNSNTGLSQSDLSSSSDDSNKAYSYGKQELYTIPMNGYSPLSPHPKIISLQQLDSIENGIDGNKIQEFETKEYNNNLISHKENTESKPFITAALLKQDTLNELTGVAKENIKVNCVENNCNGDNKTTESKKLVIKSNQIENSTQKPLPDLSNNTKVHKVEEQNNTNYKNDKNVSGSDQEIIQTNPEVVDNYENGNTNGSKENYVNETETNMDNCINGENGFDSIISLPEPPSTEEIKQMNDIILMENTQLDSLPPPPPPILESQPTPTIEITLNTNGNTNSFNNISPIPESLIEEDKLLEDEDCGDKIILPLSISKEEHPINELQNGIGGGGTVVTTPLAVTGSS